MSIHLGSTLWAAKMLQIFICIINILYTKNSLLSLFFLPFTNVWTLVDVLAGKGGRGCSCIGRVLLKFNLIFMVWKSCLYTCLCITCMPGVQGDQKWALDPLGLELQTIVSLHVGAFSCWEIFPAQRMMEMLWTLCTVNFHCQPSCRTWELEARSVTSGVQSSGSKAAAGVWNLSPTLGSKNSDEPRVNVLKGLWKILEHWSVMFCDIWFGV